MLKFRRDCWRIVYRKKIHIFLSNLSCIKAAGGNLIPQYNQIKYCY